MACFHEDKGIIHYSCVNDACFMRERVRQFQDISGGARPSTDTMLTSKLDRIVFQNCPWMLITLNLCCLLLKQPTIFMRNLGTWRVNLLATGKFEWKMSSFHAKLLLKNYWGISRVNVIGPYWWLVSIGSGNDLMLPWNDVDPDCCCHILVQNELNHPTKSKHKKP